MPKEKYTEERAKNAAVAETKIKRIKVGQRSAFFCPNCQKYNIMIYFIYGQDSYRSKRKLEEIILGYKKVHKSGLNLIYIDAKDEKDFKDFYSNFKITSMFAEKKLIVLKNVFDNAKFQEEFLEKLKI